jgi:hypothetical protein
LSVSITTYSELLTAAANWSGRADLTSRIPEFIALAEAKMNRRLREKDMVTKDAAFSITGEYVAVPTSFGGVKAFALNASPRSILLFMPDIMMTATFGDVTAPPSHYNVQGSNFRFGPIPDATYVATLIYYLKVPALTGSATTNWMITNHPDAYLYGVLAELAGLAQDWDGAGKWVQAMYAVIDEIKKASNRDSYSGDGALAARPG